MATPFELYHAGQLTEAIAAATAAVKAKPSDKGIRGFLGEMLCFAGDLERADKQLDALGQLDPELALGITLFRQLIRAEEARQQFFSDGRLPEFFEPPTPELQLRLEASIALRTGDTAQATELLQQAEAQRPLIRGSCDGQSFADLRDLDDLTSSLFEVLTAGGKYFWIPMHRVELLEFHRPERPHDLIWRRVRMVVRGGPDGEVFLPALYPGTSKSTDNQLRLGRATDWVGTEPEPIRGLGLRTFLFDETDRVILELKRIEFYAA